MDNKPYIEYPNGNRLTVFGLVDKNNKDAKSECPDSKDGHHKFIHCDEWEPTCIYCGKFQ